MVAEAVPVIIHDKKYFMQFIYIELYIYISVDVSYIYYPYIIQINLKWNEPV